jgi:hypothetical protein
MLQGARKRHFVSRALRATIETVLTRAESGRDQLVSAFIEMKDDPQGRAAEGVATMETFTFVFSSGKALEVSIVGFRMHADGRSSSRHDDAIASAPLRLVERLVGLSQKVLR